MTNTQETDYTIIDGSGQPRAIYSARSAADALARYHAESVVGFEDAEAYPSAERDYRKLGVEGFE